MDENDLRARFPGLNPGKKSPALFRLNGCGLGFYGRSEVDRPTATYVKVHCVCVLFIPLIPLGAYRVADADGGWYILGSVPLSQNLRRVRMAAAVVAVLAVLSPLWWGRTSPVATALFGDAEIERHKDVADAGDLRSAATGLRRIAANVHSDRRDDARSALAHVVELIGVDTSPEDAAAVFAIVSELGDDGTPVRTDLWERADTFIRTRADLDAQQAVAILDAVQATAPSEEAFARARRDLVERTVAARPDDDWGASELAQMLLAEDDIEGCKALLEPRAARLTDQEGARILGQIYAAEGRNEESIQLLGRYVKTRLPALVDANAAFERTWDAAQSRAISTLDNGVAPQAWYRRYDVANEAKRQELVGEYVNERLANDPAIEEAREKLIAVATVVPVAMDLGIVHMQRAHALEDEGAARVELEAAERVFAAIQGVASNDPDYQLAMARVKYWLDRPEQGQEHLAAALATGGRTHAMLQAAGHLLYSIGRAQDARVYWVESYEAATTDAERQAAAQSVSSASHHDLDESILWLERANQSDPHVVAGLAYRRSMKALRSGDRAGARRLLEQSLKVYDTLPTNATTLNNSALAAAALSGLSGDIATLEDAARRLRAALAEQQTDAVLMDNAVATLESLALRRSLPEDLDHRIDPTGLPGLLYNDAAGRNAYLATLLADEAYQAAVTISERALALDARDLDDVIHRALVAHKAQDVPRLRSLLQHVRRTPPDLERHAESQRVRLETEADPAELRSALQDQRRLLAECPPDASPRRRISAELELVSVAHVLLDNEVHVDLAEFSRLTRAAHATLPCSATRVALIDSLVHELHGELRAREPAYDAEWGRARRQVPVAMFLVEACWRDERLRTAATGSARFAELLALHQDALARFPNETRPADWGLLRLGPQSTADAATTSARASELDTLYAEIAYACYPTFSSAALMQAWVHRVHGDDARADEVLRACSETGAVVPFLK